MQRSDPPDLQEFEQLYGRDFTAFVRVATAILGDRERALEAVHDGFADAIRARWSFRGEGAFEGWVWRAVVNAARMARRRPLVEQLLIRPEPQQSGSELYSLTPLVAALPERQRLIVFLRYYADLDYRSIAAALKVDVGTVSAALAAAHRSLRLAVAAEEVHVDG